MSNISENKDYNDIIYIRKCIHEIYIYRKDEDKNANAEPTIDELNRLLNEAKERFIKYLEQEKNNLKQLEKTFSKYEKITKALKDFFNETPNKYDYKKQLEYMIL